MNEEKILYTIEINSESAVITVKNLREEMGKLKTETDEVNQGFLAFSGKVLKSSFETISNAGKVNKTLVGWHGTLEKIIEKMSGIKTMSKEWLGVDSAVKSVLKGTLTGIYDGIEFFRIYRMEGYSALDSLKGAMGQFSGKALENTTYLKSGIDLFKRYREKGVGSFTALRGTAKQLGTKFLNNTKYLKKGVDAFKYFKSKGNGSIGSLIKTAGKFKSTWKGAFSDFKVGALGVTAAFGAAVVAGKAIAAVCDEWSAVEDRRLKSMHAQSKSMEKIRKFVNSAQKEGLADEIAKEARRLRIEEGITGDIAKIRIYGKFRDKYKAIIRAREEQEKYGKACQAVKDIVDRQNVSVAEAVKIYAKQKEVVESFNKQKKDFALRMGFIVDIPKLKAQSKLLTGVFKDYKKEILGSAKHTKEFLKHVKGALFENKDEASTKKLKEVYKTLIKYNKEYEKIARQRDTRFDESMGIINPEKTMKSVDQLVESYKKHADKIKESSKLSGNYREAAKKLAEQLKDNGENIPESLSKIMNSYSSLEDYLNNAKSAEEYNERLTQMMGVEIYSKGLNTLGINFEKVGKLASKFKKTQEETGSSTDETDKSVVKLNASLELLDKSFNLLSGAFKNLGINAGGIINCFSDMTKGVKTFENGIEQASKGSIVNMFKSKGDGVEGIKGFFSNFSAGLSSISSMAAGATAIIGTFAKGLKAIFGGGHNWSKWVNNLNRAKIPLGKFQGEIEELAKKLRKNAKSTQDAAEQAYNTYLAQVIREADVKTENFKQYAQSVFNMLYQVDNVLNGDSSANLDETVSQLGDAFAALAEKQKLSNTYSTEMKNIMVELNARGIEVAEVEKYRTEMNNSAFESYKKLHDTTALEKYRSEYEKLKESMSSMKSGTDDFENAQQKLLEYQAKIDEAQSELDIFGASSIELYEQMARDEKALAEQQGLVDKVKEFNNLIISFSNVNDVTEEQFKGFQDSAGRAFEKLCAGGMESELALRQLAPSLTRLIELSNTHGLTIDAGTQKMIDQARAAGISLEKQIDPQERMVNILEKIAIRFGCDIPDAMETMADRAEDSFSRAADNLSVLESGADAFGSSLNSAGRNYDLFLSSLNKGRGSGGSRLPESPQPGQGAGQNNVRHEIYNKFDINVSGSASRMEKDEIALTLKQILKDGTRGVDQILVSAG